jgi:hypothetical protein
MSIYSFLSSPAPTIAYCAMHQALPAVPEDEYVKTMKELHERIALESEAINAEYTKHLTDTVTHEVETIHGSLSTFLHTPISSDDDDVRRILAEALGKFKEMLVERSLFGLQSSIEGRVFFAPTKKAMEKKLLQAGKTYVENLGFKPTKENGGIFESMFVITGGLNLDILEHIVRDRLGIYSTTHGKHIKEFGEYAYTAYNLVHAKGEIPAKDSIRNHFEATFHFSKPDVKYAPFRNALIEAIEKLSAEIELPYVSLWQRKLGLGVGKEFTLRIISASAEQISGSIQRLESYKDNEFVRQAVIVDGSLVLKELLF